MKRLKFQFWGEISLLHGIRNAMIPKERKICTKEC